MVHVKVHQVGYELGLVLRIIMSVSRWLQKYRFQISRRISRVSSIGVCFVQVLPTILILFHFNVHRVLTQSRLEHFPHLFRLKPFFLLLLRNLIIFSVSTLLLLGFILPVLIIIFVVLVEYNFEHVVEQLVFLVRFRHC